MEDTFKDIAVYSTLAMILFRKGQEKDQELEDMIKNPESEESRFISRKHLEPVDEKYNGDESFTHPIIAMREAAEKQQEEEQRRSDENLAHIKSLMERDANNN